MDAKPVSLQLYSLRESSAKDFPAVIRAVGEIGYAGVEPAGFYGLKPRELQAARRGPGHAHLVEPRTVVVAREPRGGHRHRGRAGREARVERIRPEAFADMAAIRATAEKVNLMDERLRAAGLTLFLHNH